MRWPWNGDGSKEGATAAVSSPTSSSSASADLSSPSSSSSFTELPPVKQLVSWTESLKEANWEHYKDPQAWVTPTLAVGAALGFSAFYRSYLRRIPSTNHIQPRYFRRRSLLGKVTSVGDGDNFHLYHTPGGWLAGWGWLRKVPSYRKDLKGKTISVRIAGVDAPECAHFGRPAQPYSGEALDFLTSYLLGRRVRVYLFRQDQYERVVARVVVRRFLFFRSDVGLAMLKRGLATCYEAKTGVEFGGREAQYRVAEVRARTRKRGLWAGSAGKGGIETPREYKTRMAVQDAEKGHTTTTAPTTAAPKPALPAPAATPPAAVASSAKPSAPATVKPSTTGGTSSTSTFSAGTAAKITSPAAKPHTTAPHASSSSSSTSPSAPPASAAASWAKGVPGQKL
ncbi:nuclease domain-containing protein 1 [Grosmannia clavigera kw1407]|uniref:Probable endonuclease LCL3 n=1 Tax=Grosmannia clavigera (strain kw1407 / UAMH 11150) TaxID=655863 RepID=F0XR47_GROCL|nr:nuclease domain-containing protein 1 [Grosmannia clavigera kw1407]EFW99837.1 nuclease domain-containing protein 1 [Grosmannia clavigera kw1407]